MGKRKPLMSDMLQLVAKCFSATYRTAKGCPLWDVTGAHLDGLAEAPNGPILHRRDEVG